MAKKNDLRLEAIIGNGMEAAQKGITTQEDQEQYIRSFLLEETATPAQLQADFKAIFPGQDVIVTNKSEIAHRQQIHENAVNRLVAHAAERGAYIRPAEFPRALREVFQPEHTEADIAYNKRFSDAFARKDYAEMGRLYEEHIMNLPTYDPEMIRNIPAEDLPDVFCRLYTTYVASLEAKKFLTDNNEVESSMRAAMSPEALARLAELEKDADLFTNMKSRLDDMFSTYYPYVNTEKITSNVENSTALLDYAGDDLSVLQFIGGLNNNISFTHNGDGRLAELMMKNAGIDTSNLVARDYTGEEYRVASGGADGKGGCEQVLLRGEPLFLSADNQVKAFVLKDGMPVEVNPAEAMDKITKDIAKKADEVLNGSVADPFWLATGSAEYRGMKSALAEYKKAGQIDSPAAVTALENLQKSADDYFTRKGVDMNTCPDFDSFKANHPTAGDMSERELARMEGAYKMLEIGKSAASTAEMRKELSAMPTYFAPIKPQPSYAERAKTGNAAIQNSSFLKDPIPAAQGVTAGEKLRQDLTNSLLDPQNGLLNKKFFTKEDRQATDDILAKAIILDMIRSGREITQNSPVGIERAYNEVPDVTLSTIKGTAAFQKAKDNLITPDGLLNFFTENRQAGINKEISTGVAQQHKAKTVMQNQQNQPQMTMQATNSMQAQQPTVAQPEPPAGAQLGGPPMG